MCLKCAFIAFDSDFASISTAAATTERRENRYFARARTSINHCNAPADGQGNADSMEGGEREREWEH